jgi:hypothetical protein
MKTPADGWDRAEQEALRDLEQSLDAIRDRHRADPPIELLQAARGDVLSEELQDEVTRHLAESAWSRALVDGVRYEGSALSSDDEARLLARIQKGATELPRRRSFWQWFSQPGIAAAAAVLILAAGLFAWRIRPPRTEETRPPQIAVTTAPSAPVFRLPLAAPPVRLSVAVLTWRGVGAQNPLLTSLKPGLDAFRGGDYSTANAELSKSAAAYPDSFDVRYYQGLSRLFVNDVRGAIESLEAAQRGADSSFAPDVAWYLGVAYERAGRMEDARKQLMDVCKANAAHVAEACAGVQQIK